MIDSLERAEVKFGYPLNKGGIEKLCAYIASNVERSEVEIGVSYNERFGDRNFDLGSENGRMIARYNEKIDGICIKKTITEGDIEMELLVHHNNQDRGMDEYIGVVFCEIPGARIGIYRENSLRLMEEVKQCVKNFFV
jgi:hypothetical protein